MFRHRTRLAAALLMIVTLFATLTVSTGTATAAVASTNARTAPGVLRTGGHVSPNDNWWACGPAFPPGNICDDTDPYDTGCSSSGEYTGSSYAWLGSTKWQLQLWYSTACETVWTRLQLLSGSNSCYQCYLYIVRNETGTANYTTLSVGSSTGTLYSGAWTNQLYLPPNCYWTTFEELTHNSDVLAVINEWNICR